MVRHRGCKGQARAASARQKKSAPREGRAILPLRILFRCCARATRATQPSRRSVLAGRAVGALHVPLEAPAIDHLGVETPVGADPESRKLSATQKFVDR